MFISSLHFHCNSAHCTLSSISKAWDSHTIQLSLRQIYLSGRQVCQTDNSEKFPTRAEVIAPQILEEMGLCAPHHPPSETICSFSCRSFCQSWLSFEPSVAMVFRYNCWLYRPILRVPEPLHPSMALSSRLADTHMFLKLKGT